MIPNRQSMFRCMIFSLALFIALTCSITYAKNLSNIENIEEYCHMREGQLRSSLESDPPEWLRDIEMEMVRIVDRTGSQKDIEPIVSQLLSFTKDGQDHRTYGAALAEFLYLFADIIEPARRYTERTGQLFLFFQILGSQSINMDSIGAKLDNAGSNAQGGGLSDEEMAAIFAKLEANITETKEPEINAKLLESIKDERLTNYVVLWFTVQLSRNLNQFYEGQSGSVSDSGWHVRKTLLMLRVVSLLPETPKSKRLLLNYAFEPHGWIWRLHAERPVEFKDYPWIPEDPLAWYYETLVASTPLEHEFIRLLNAHGLPTPQQHRENSQ